MAHPPAPDRVRAVGPPRARRHRRVSGRCRRPQPDPKRGSPRVGRGIPALHQLGERARPARALDRDYGYVTIEGMAAARPVVVTSDSGGPLEFVHDEVNGSVVDPEPEAIAAAFDRLFTDRQLAQRMGSAGRTFVTDHVPQWPEV